MIRVVGNSSGGASRYNETIERQPYFQRASYDWLIRCRTFSVSVSIFLSVKPSLSNECNACNTRLYALTANFSRISLFEIRQPQKWSAIVCRVVSVCAPGQPSGLRYVLNMLCQAIISYSKSATVYIIRLFQVSHTAVVPFHKQTECGRQRTFFFFYLVWSALSILLLLLIGLDYWNNIRG